MNRHGWREVRRQLHESGPTGAVAVLLVAVATTWGGALWLAHNWVERELLAHGRPAAVVAAIRGPGDAAVVRQALAGRYPSAQATVSPPGRTKEELARWFPELSGVLLGLEDRSFPTLLQSEVPADQAQAVASFLRGRPEVILVESSRDWQGRLERTLSGVLLAGFSLAVALLVGCSVVVLLVVRLLVLEHADEIAIMRLIGAKERDIRMPYLACGSLLGALGGAFGVLALALLSVLLGAGEVRVQPSVGALLSIPLLGGVVGCLGAVFGLATLPEEP